jgi:hypothetical protein
VDGGPSAEGKPGEVWGRRLGSDFNPFKVSTY